MRFFAILMSGFLFCAPVLASETVSPEGAFGEWRVYTAKEGSETLCFMVSSPQHTTTEREENFLTVTHRPYENSYNVISLMFGTTFHKTSRPTIEVDNHRPFELKTSDDSAFLKNEKDDLILISQMIEGNVARTKGKNHKKTLLRETFSLKGFSKAYELLNEKCPMQKEEVGQLQEAPVETSGEVK